MPVPRINRQLYKISENDKKLDMLEVCLHKMGYVCDEPRDMLKIIDVCKLDKSQFDFPYGSYEMFKLHVLKGDYDDDFTLKLMTSEELKDLDDAIAKGRACMTC